MVSISLLDPTIFLCLVSLDAKDGMLSCLGHGLVKINVTRDHTMISAGSTITTNLVQSLYDLLRSGETVKSACLSVGMDWNQVLPSYSSL